MSNKEFQVRHGLIVNNDVLVANTITTNVGIGRANPEHKLDVVGTINASSILINGQPIDFSSANNYSGYLANSSNDYAQSLSFSSNSWSNTVGTAGNNWVNNTFLPLTGGVVTGNITANNLIVEHDVEIERNLTVQGNVFIYGTTTSVTAANFSISDNLIYLNEARPTDITFAYGDGANVTYTANNNFVPGGVVRVAGIDPVGFNTGTFTYVSIIAANSTSFTVANTFVGTYVSGGVAYYKAAINPDIGFAGGYNDGIYHHAGFFRDATDGTFKVFDNYVPEPGANVNIDTTHPSFSLAKFAASQINANSIMVGIINVESALVGAFNKANAANVLAFNTGVGANAYSEFVGQAGNNYSDVVGIAGNNYTNVAGSAGNNYTNAVGASGNSYTEAAAAAGNNYANYVGSSSNNFASYVGTSSNSYADATFTTKTDSAVIFIHSNAAFDAANAGGSSANLTPVYTHANTVGDAGNSYTNTVGTAGNNYSNYVGDAGNSYTNTIGTAGNNYSNYVGVSANAYAASLTPDLSPAFNTANAAYDKANSANLLAHNTGIGANSYADLAANGANAYASTLYVSKSGDTISGDLVIQGNVTISGETIYANTQTLLIGDNIVVLNSELPYYVPASENAGIEVNRGTEPDVSVIWNEALDKWTFTNDGSNTVLIASNTDVESANIYSVEIGTAGNNYTNFVGTAGNNYTNFVGTAGNNYTNFVGTAGNTYSEFIGLSVNVYTSQVTFDLSIGANTHANTVATAGNNYTNEVGTAGNNHANYVGTSANSYALSTATNIGAAGNNYTNTVGTSGNNYTNTVGTAGNNYTNTTTNTRIGWANNWANQVGVYANTWANTKLANTNITVSGNVSVQGNVTVASANAYNFGANAYMLYNSACNSIDFVIN